MPTQDLVFQFFGVDRGAGSQFERMGAKASSASGSLAKFGAASAVAAGVVAVASLKMAADFQTSTEMIHTQAGASQAEVNKMRGAILSLAGPTATAPEELSVALYHIESTGQRGATALNELRIAAEGAKVGGANLEDVTNALNATIVSGIGGVHNFSQAMGALNAIVGAGDMHMQDLATALGTGVLAVIKGYGVNLTQAGAALAVFGDNNIRGADAATALRMTVQSLTHPAKTATDALAQLGLTGNDAFTHFAKDLQQGGLTKALTDLHDRLVRTGNTGAKTGQILTDAFGKKAGVGLAVLISQFNRYELKLAEVRQGAHGFGDEWTATTKNLSFQFDRLRANVDVIAIRIGDALIPAAMGALHGIEGLGNATVTTVRFFQQHEAASAALAGVLTATLVPALAVSARWMAANVFEGAAMGLYKVTYAVSGLVGALTTLDVAQAAALGGLGIAIAGATYAWEKNRSAQAAAKKQADDYVTSLNIQTTSLSSLSQNLTNIQNQFDKIAGTHLDISKTKVVGGPDTTQLRELQTQYLKYAAVQRNVAFNEQHLAQGYGLTQSQVENLARTYGVDLTGSLQAADDGMGKAIQQAQQSRDSSKIAAAGFSDMGSAATTASQALQDLSSSFDALLGNFLGVKSANLAFKNAIVTLDGALKKSHNSLSLNTAAGRASRQAYIDAAAALNSVGTAMEKNNAPIDAIRARMQTMLGQFGKTPAGGALVTATLARIRKEIAGAGAGSYASGARSGLDYIDGLTGSLRANAQAVAAAAAAVGHQVDVAVRGRDGISAMSPSKKAIQSGKDYVDGLTIGLNSKSKHKDVYHAATNIAHLLAQGMLDGWTGEAGRVKNILGTGVENAINGLTSRVLSAIDKQKAAVKTAQQALHSTLSSRRGDTKSLAGTIAQGAGLSNAFGTDVNGTSYALNVSQFLGGQIAPLRTFSRDLAMLHKRGLSPALLGQIANLGPEQGIQVAGQILAGQDSIRKLNAQQSLISRYSTSAASVTEHALYAGTVARDRRDIREQRDLLRKIERHLHNMERHAAREVARHTTVTIDAKGHLKLTRDDAREITRALRELDHNVGVTVRKAR